MSERAHLRLVPCEAAGLHPSGRPDPGHAALEAELADLREALFTFADCLRRALPGRHDAVHVALQAAAHHLTEAERRLRRQGE